MKRGLTLAELMIAAFITVFSVSAILLLFMNCIFMNTASRNTTIATSHAQYALEEIRNTPFASIPGTWNGATWDSTVVQSKGLSALDSEIINIGATSTDPIQVTVTVNWDDDGVRARSITLETLIADY